MYVTPGLFMPHNLPTGLDRRPGSVWGEDMTPKVLWEVVKEAATRAGREKLAPHDLRRTCARLCHLASGELDQIQWRHIASGAGFCPISVVRKGCSRQLSVNTWRLLVTYVSTRSFRAIVEIESMKRWLGMVS